MKKSDSQRRKYFIWKCMILITALTAVFWLGWRLCFGSVPATNELVLIGTIAQDYSLIIPLSFPVSRLMDIFLAPILAGIFAYYFSGNDREGQIFVGLSSGALGGLLLCFIKPTNIGMLEMTIVGAFLVLSCAWILFPRYGEVVGERISFSVGIGFYFVAGIFNGLLNGIGTMPIIIMLVSSIVILTAMLLFFILWAFSLYMRDFYGKSIIGG